METAHCRDQMRRDFVGPCTVCLGQLASDSLILRLVVSVGRKHAAVQNRKGQVRKNIFPMVCCRNSFCSRGDCLLFGWATVQTLRRQARACVDPSVLPVETRCLTDFVCCSWLLSIFVVFISSHTFTAFCRACIIGAPSVLAGHLGPFSALHW